MAKVMRVYYVVFLWTHVALSKLVQPLLLGDIFASMDYLPKVNGATCYYSGLTNSCGSSEANLHSNSFNAPGWALCLVHHEGERTAQSSCPKTEPVLHFFDRLIIIALPVLAAVAQFWYFSTTSLSACIGWTALFWMLCNTDRSPAIAQSLINFGLIRV